MTKPIQSYEAAGVTVTFDPNVCTHSGNCVRGLAAVFDVKRKPWIAPGAAPAAAVAAQIAKCPSGALKFSQK